MDDIDKRIILNYIRRKSKKLYYFPNECAFLKVSDKKIEVYSGATCKHKWGEIKYSGGAWVYNQMMSEFSDKYLDVVYEPAYYLIFLFTQFLNKYGYDELHKIIENQ